MVATRGEEEGRLAEYGLANVDVRLQFLDQHARGLRSAEVAGGVQQ
jgi:hypothetical protein